MPAYGYFTRSIIQNSPIEERPKVRATIHERYLGETCAIQVDATILTVGNNPTIIAKYHGDVRYFTLGWSLLLAVLNDPTERPIVMENR